MSDTDATPDDVEHRGPWWMLRHELRYLGDRASRFPRCR